MKQTLIEVACAYVDGQQIGVETLSLEDRIDKLRRAHVRHRVGDPQEEVRLAARIVHIILLPDGNGTEHEFGARVVIL